MINKNKILGYTRNLSIYFGASLIPMILNLIANPWIAKNMSPEDYAISGYYASFSSLISPIIIFYMVHYYIKEYYRMDEGQRENLYATIAKATIWFSGLVSIFCFFTLLIYLRYFNDTLSFPINPYLALMVFSLPLTGLLNLQLARYRMEKKANAYFRLSFCNGVLNIVLSLLFVVWLKWGAFGKLLGPLVCNGTVFLVMLILFRKYLSISTSFDDFRKVFIFCLPLSLSAMLGYFTNGFSTTYLESVRNTTEYGYYIVGNTIGAYLTVFGAAIGNTFQPDLYETTIKKQWRRYSLFCFLQIGLIAMIVILFIVFAPFIINILTAGRYILSVPYAQIIALSTLTSGIYYLINNYSIATNRPKLYLYTSLVGSGIIIAIVPVAVDRWQYVGGAWIIVISYALFALINLGFLGVARFKKIRIKHTYI